MGRGSAAGCAAHAYIKNNKGSLLSSKSSRNPPPEIKAQWKNAGGNNFIGKLTHLAENF